MEHSDDYYDDLGDDDDDFDDDYYYEQYEAIISEENYRLSIKTDLDNIRKLSKLEIGDTELLKIFKRQLYIAGIGALEAFLSEKFTSLIQENDEYFQQFLKTYPEFEKEKIPLSNILEAHKNIDKKVRRTILDIIFHNLGKVKKMYKSTFNIDFPDITELSRCVTTRHHLVHRSGKDENGEAVEINQEMIEDLLDKVYQFIKDISEELEDKLN